MDALPASSVPLHASNIFISSGQVILVTGGGTGIGAMISRTLAYNGAKVYIVGRREEVLESCVKAFEAENPDGPGSLVAMVGDIGSKDGIEALKTKLELVEPALDILINNAGISGSWINADPKDITTISETMWSVPEKEAIEVYQTNVLGPYFTSAAFLPLLGRSTRHPQIIMISSASAFCRDSFFGMIYPLSKAAVNHLTKVMATELISTGVRCNAIAPGLFPSQMIPTSDTERKIVNRMLAISPLGRTGTEQEMGATILYLTSEHSSYINGAVIPVEGGGMCTVPSTY